MAKSSKNEIKVASHDFLTPIMEVIEESFENSKPNSNKK